MAAKDKLRWLEGQLPLWAERGVITPDQAAKIRQQYGVLEPETSLARAVFSSVGAILIGLGVILFFAFNWADMPHWSKLIVIFGGLAASQLGAWWVYPNRKLLGESLFVLGTMMFGSTIFLVSQIYHIDDHYPNAFLLWGVAALLLAWMIPSLIQGLIAAFLLALWLGMEAFEFNLVPWYSAPLLIGGFIPLAWSQRSRVLMAAACGLTAYAVGITIAEYIDETFGVFLAYAATALVMLVASRMSVSAFPSGGKIMGAFGMVLHLGCLYTFGFDYILDEGLLEIDLGTGYEKACFAAALAAYIGLFIWRVRFSKKPLGGDWLAHLVLVSISLGCVAILAFVGSFDATAAWVWANLAFATHCGLWVSQGSREQRGGLVTIACLLFIAMAIPRFLGMFDSLLMRSLVFLLLGGGLFAVGNFYQNAGPKKAGADTQGEDA